MLFLSSIEEKWTLEIELVIDDELDSDDENSSTLQILTVAQPQVDDNTNAAHVTLKLQDIMKCHVVLARCSVIVVIDDGMPFITIVSIFSDRRTPPIAERQQQRALLLVAYLSSVHTVVFVFRVFIVDDSCNTSASIVDHHRPEGEREHATQDTARLSNTGRFIASWPTKCLLTHVSW